MGTATISEKGGNQERGEVRPGDGVDAPDDQAGQPGGSCGLLGQIDDDRIRLMGLIVRTHRQSDRQPRP